MVSLHGALEHRRDVEPPAIVSNLDEELLIFWREPDSDAFRSGVAHGVSQTFLDDTESADLDFRREPQAIGGEVDVDRKPVQLRLPFEVTAKGEHQPELVEERRAQVQGNGSNAL